jgi:leucyl-tRNA synthetase
MDVEDAKAAVIARAEAKAGARARPVWPARLGRLAPALLGHADPVHPLRCCGVVPVPKGQLPVVLPDDVTFDIPGNPLDRHPTWKHVDCPPAARRPARDRHARHLRRFELVFPALRQPARRQAVRQGRIARWLPVDQYIGGDRARDPAPALFPLLDPRAEAIGKIAVKEPFAGLFTQGMVTHETY